MSPRHPSDSRSGSSPRQAAGLVMAGKREHFSDETLALLRSRLTIAALLSAIVLFGTFVFDLFIRGLTLAAPHLAVFAIFAAAYALLRSRRALSAVQLRSAEVVLFALLNVLLLALLTATAASQAKAGLSELVVSERDFFTQNFCLAVVGYGLFIPNGIRRAAAIMLPFGVIAYIYPMLFGKINPAVGAMFWKAPANMVFPAPLLAATIAVLGAHTLYSVRRKAFDARRFGQYVLGEAIGHGGMGEVYRAEHVLLKRPSAIKLIRPDLTINERSLARFEREVKATARLRHWNTVEVFDYGRTDDGTFYYVMELLSGMNLEELVHKHGPLPPARVVYLLRQACNALREAHAAGLVHRDIKPANLYCAELGGVYDVVKLLDFGLVRDPETQEQATDPRVVGSPYYIAPEQITDPMAATPQSDLYALGALGYYLLTGRPPFDKPNKLSVLYAHTHEPPKPPSEVLPNLPQDLDQIVMRCLLKNPAERFESAEQLEIALSNCSCANDWSHILAAQWWQRQATT